MNHMIATSMLIKELAAAREVIREAKNHSYYNTPSKSPIKKALERYDEAMKEIEEVNMEQILTPAARKHMGLRIE